MKSCLQHRGRLLCASARPPSRTTPPTTARSSTQPRRKASWWSTRPPTPLLRRPAQGLPVALSGRPGRISDLNSTELYNRFIAEAAAGSGTPTCCVVGHGPAGQARRRRPGADHASPETPRCRSGRREDQAYGTTYEPIAFIYNKRWCRPRMSRRTTRRCSVPHHQDEAYKGKITAYIRAFGRRLSVRQ